MIKAKIEMKKFFVISLAAILLLALTVPGFADPVLISPLPGTETTNQPMLVWSDPAATDAVVEIANKSDIDPTDGYFVKANLVLPREQVWKPRQYWDLKAWGLVLQPGTYYWHVISVYWGGPIWSAWSPISYFTVPTPAIPTVTPTPTPTPSPTPPTKVRVLNRFHKKICIKNKKYHAKHCRATKSKKQSKKNKKFHNKKCTKLISK